MNEAGNFLADAVRQADDTQLLDVRRILIDLFDFIGINVLAVRVDDDVFRSADEIEIAFVVDATEVARVEPTIHQRFLGRFVISKIAEHHIRSARDDFADAAGIRIRDANLNARKRLAHSA